MLRYKENIICLPTSASEGKKMKALGKIKSWEFLVKLLYIQFYYCDGIFLVLILIILIAIFQLTFGFHFLN